MKVQELVEIISKNKNKMFKAEQLKELIKKTLEVKNYISIKGKKQLVDSIVNECILYEDGIYKFDDIDKYICFIMKTIDVYTNLELSDDIEKDYDILCEAQILELIIDTFKKEYDDVNVLLQMKCDYILSGNNIEAQVGKFLDGLLEKADSLVNVLSDKVGNFDINNLPFEKKDIGKILEFFNAQK
jgi:hypothetical protein